MLNAMDNQRDPVVTPILQCRNTMCGQPMGSLRVYQGKGSPNRQHLRGSLVQSVRVSTTLPLYILTFFW